MSDELPTEDRLRRIEREVQRRIDARRATVRSIRRGLTGGVVAVLLVGGFALLRPIAGISTASSGADSAARAPSTAVVPVICHDGTVRTVVTADRSTLPASALRACAAAPFGAAARPGVAGASSASPTATTSPRVLCRAEDGALHVYVGAAGVCTVHGMTTYPG